MTVVRIVTTSSTKMTGVFTSVRGSSLLKDAPTAGQSRLGSSSVDALMPLRVVELCIVMAPGLIGCEQNAGGHCQVLDDGAKSQRREKRQTADDEDHADQQANEQGDRGRAG